MLGLDLVNIFWLEGCIYAHKYLIFPSCNYFWFLENPEFCPIFPFWFHVFEHFWEVQFTINMFSFKYELFNFAIWKFLPGSSMLYFNITLGLKDCGLIGLIDVLGSFIWKHRKWRLELWLFFVNSKFDDFYYSPSFILFQELFWSASFRLPQLIY